MRLCRADRRYPHIGFIPTAPRYDGLFQRLLHVEVEQDGGQWKLCSHSSESWSALETTLIKVADRLFSLRQTLPLYFERFPAPSRYGYLRRHPNQETAHRCARNSRLAFLHLGATITYAIVMITPNSADLKSPAPGWIKQLHAIGVHHSWVESFRQSQFADFQGTRRFGTVVHSRCFWLNEVEAMVNVGVPVWIEWGEVGGAPLDTTTTPYLNRFRPAPDVVKQVPGESVDPTPPIDDVLQSEPYTVRHLRSHLQRQGESWRDFFERQELALKRLKQSETPSQRLTRENRELASKTWGGPSKKGPLVFNWVEEDGDWIRVKLTRREAADWWETSRRCHRKFHSNLNQWDLYPEPISDPSFDPEDDSDYDEDDEDYQPFPSTTFLDPPRLPSDGPEPTGPAPVALPQSDQDRGNIWMRTLALGYHALKTPGLDVPIENPPLLDLLHIRYGFTSSSRTPETTAYNDIFQIKTVFGHREAGNPLTRTEIDQLQAFFHTLETGGRMSTTLCDLYTDNPRSISDVLPSISVVIWRLSAVHYELVPLQPAVKTPWRLLTTDPLTVLQCI